VFLLHFVAHVPQGFQLVVELAGLGDEVHVVRIELLVLGALLVDAVPVLVGHALETANQVLVFAVELGVARVVFGQAFLQLLDFLVEPVDALVFVFLLAFEALAGFVELLVLVGEAQFEFFLLEVDLVKILVGFLQFVG